MNRIVLHRIAIAAKLASVGLRRDGRVTVT
jgi:hypothetical protein